MPITSFGSCQALRKIAEVPSVIARVEVTPEWLAENEAKHASYKETRAMWSKPVD